MRSEIRNHQGHRTGRRAQRLRLETNLVSNVTWQPPWLEHPEQIAELIAHLWLNQSPEVFGQLANRLAETNLGAVLAATREQLATTLSPADLAQLSYDPFGLTQLPPGIAMASFAPGFGQGQGLFRVRRRRFSDYFCQKRAHDLNGYRECTDWFNAVKVIADTSVSSTTQAAIGYTGRPAFVAEISASMRHDMVLSIGGTSLIIAVLFWLAHRRWKPMLWLMTLLAMILAGTLALGGLFFGTINVVSMGFAAILLGLAVDYAVVHYQEALAHPDLSIPEIRRAIAPSIYWAAVTTISAFLVLNFSGLPGLAQLGSLVGIGVALSACVMIFAFLPPLFLPTAEIQKRTMCRLRYRSENLLKRENLPMHRSCSHSPWPWLCSAPRPYSPGCLKWIPPQTSCSHAIARRMQRSTQSRNT